jgi:putative transposase
MNRGSVRSRLFLGAHDYRAFIAVLSETIERFGLPLLSYCLMPNHWHLVVRPESQRHLSVSLQWLTGTHANRWCRAHDRDGPGPVYQGRFRSIAVAPNVHLARVCRYVERNALKAALVPRAEDWPWSSANQRIRNGNSPPLVPLQFLTPEIWLEFLNVASKDTAVEAAIRLNRAFGDEEWLQSKGIGAVPPRGRPRKPKNE